MPVLCAPPVDARVVRVEVTSRQEVLGGRSFGDAGVYVRIVGPVCFSLPVENQHNADIVDLKCAVNLKDGAAGLFFAGAMDPLAALLDHQLDEIEEHQDVDGEQADARPGDAADDLVNLPGQKRNGDGKGEEFAPGLLKIKAQAFGNAEAGVTEGRQADAAQLRIVDQRGFLQQKIDQARLGVEAEMVGEGGEYIGEVFVEQAVRADADGDEQKRLGELEGGY
ncbi:MAG: hypothetical protein WBE72_09620 [Terracidiphilus sp.]